MEFRYHDRQTKTKKENKSVKHEQFYEQVLVSAILHIKPCMNCFLETSQWDMAQYNSISETIHTAPAWREAAHDYFLIRQPERASLREQKRRER